MIKRGFGYWALGVLLLLLSFQYASADSAVVGFRHHDHAEYTRLVFELTAPTTPHVFTLNSPPRIVIDLTNTEWKGTPPASLSSTRVKKIRRGMHDGKGLRIVLDTHTSMRIVKSFQLAATNTAPPRFVLDIATDASPHTTKPSAPTTAPPASHPPKPTIPNTPIPSIATDAPVPIAKTIRPPVPPTPQKPLIIVDAGHGGKDPGATGYTQTREKYLTLAYAKALQDALVRTGRYRVKLTRTGDYYITLRNRVNIARKAAGDLFISLHADSHNNRRTRGLSIYTLSEKASDREAAALASKANSEDIIHGIDFNEQYDDITDILIDLVQRNTTNQSSRLAEILTSALQKEVKLLRNAHRFAGFRVLTAPDIPSVLIELGYLSNRNEEKLLNTESYKQSLIRSIVQGVDAYFQE